MAILRLRELTVERFRSFGAEPTLLDFTDGHGHSQPIVVFHGENGAGKSSALRAIELLFNELVALAENGGSTRKHPWGTNASEVDRRSWHRSDTTHAIEMSARVEGLPMSELDMRLVPSGREVMVSASAWSDEDERAAVLEALTARWEAPFVRIDAQRHPPWKTVTDKEQRSVFHSELLSRLYNFTQSIEVDEVNRWKSFQRLSSAFPAFDQATLSIRQPNGLGQTLVLEDGSGQFRAFHELSSGEQQVLTLCALIVVSRARIVAIEEPELNLSPDWQRRLRRMLDQLINDGVVDQVFLESHVPTFDGPEVLRFARNEDGTTRVARTPSQAETQSEEVRRAAEKAGAAQRWVTPDGFTQLPDAMTQHVANSHVWFLPRHGHWEAWPEAQLQELMGAEDPLVTSDLAKGTSKQRRTKPAAKRVRAK